jgi:hypothetical protein
MELIHGEPMVRKYKTSAGMQKYKTSTDILSLPVGEPKTPSVGLVVPKQAIKARPRIGRRRHLGISHLVKQAVKARPQPARRHLVSSVHKSKVPASLPVRMYKLRAKNQAVLRRMRMMLTGHGRQIEMISIIRELRDNLEQQAEVTHLQLIESVKQVMTCDN